MVFPTQVGPGCRYVALHPSMGTSDCGLLIAATLTKLLQEDLTYQNNFTEIIFNFMRGPYTSGIGQIMQKYFLGWELVYRGQTP